MLTPSQEKSYFQLINLSATFPLLILQGDRESGKRMIAEKFFDHFNNTHKIVSFDLLDISTLSPGSLSPENFYNHLLKLSKEGCGEVPNKPRWIYIRHWEKIKEIVEDYGIPHRYYPRYVLARLAEDLKIGTCQLLVTSDCEIKLDSNKHWIIKHNTSKEDASILMLRNGFTADDVERLAYMSGNAKPGYILQAITYSLAFPQAEKEERFKEALVKICGSEIEPEKTVTETQPNINLIGFESIIEEINRSILCPIEFSCDEVPLKKGIVLAGPPGTGKTSIGRWLAYRLHGKMYIVDGSAGVSGNAFLESVTEAFEKAYRNAPAIVFIDDVDTLFEHADTYRSFLTLLDGLENKKRGSICVIVTCNEIVKIPSSLIRGGRLELCLETKLPDEEVREKILQLGFDKILLLLTRFENEKKISPIVNLLRNQLTSKFIRDLTSRMTLFNCADIHRYLDDTLRYILEQYASSNLSDKLSLADISTRIIVSIRRQYQLVRRPEDLADYARIYG